MKKILFLLCIINNALAHGYFWKTSSDYTHYIWNFGIIFATDKGFNKSPRTYFAEEFLFNKNNYRYLRSGDVVWLPCRFIAQFCQEILPGLAVPIVLVISDGDESFPSDCGKDFNVEPLLNSANIIHVFAQNNDYKGPSNKVSHLPIGIDFHTVAYKDGGWGELGSPAQQETLLNRILRTLKPTYKRKKGAFVDFHHSDTMHASFQRYLQFGEDRKSIFQRIITSGLIDYGPSMRRSELWKKKGEYAFSISPHGNGLDCHRTWEDLALGCIVIVKTSSLDPMYEGLPVIIIKDWSEINAHNFDKWLYLYGDAFTNSDYREKLTNAYWLSKIQAKAEPYKHRVQYEEVIIDSIKRGLLCDISQITAVRSYLWGM